jgi:methylenetetrahydrofolate dehydrogenase (NADP+)/methenyltetrahydrofolate cyclohydrolase
MPNLQAHPMQLLNGKILAQEILTVLKEKTKGFCQKSDLAPGLAVILVGENKASQIYVQKKRQTSQDLGFVSKDLNFPDTITESELGAVIADLNADDRVHGILIQLPLPRHLNSARILNWVDPRKDVDGFTDQNAGRLYLGTPSFFPCTPKGILRLLKHYEVPLSGKQAVVLGRSTIVGKPTAMLLLQENCTVTICHSRTQNLDNILQSADIIVAAVGHPEFVRGRQIKEGACIVDVGINRLNSGVLKGDVCFSEAAEKAAFLTPVPGGVGPMTIAMLMENTLEAANNFYARGREKI